MDEDVDARERLFHNVVREYIVSMGKEFSTSDYWDANVFTSKVY